MYYTKQYILTYLLNYFRFKVWPDVTHWVLNLFIRGVFTVFRPPKVQTLHIGAVRKRRCLKMFHFWPSPSLFNFLDRLYVHSLLGYFGTLPYFMETTSFMDDPFVTSGGILVFLELDSPASRVAYYKTF